MKAPYVGITGFKTAREVKGVLDSWDPSKFHGFRLMLGFLCSAQRLAYITERGRVSPAAKDLSKLVREAHMNTRSVDLPRLAKGLPPTVLPMIHYHTTNREGLAEEVNNLFNMNHLYRDSFCRALQINMTWPDVDQIKKIKDRYPEMEVLLSITGTAIKGKTPGEIADRAATYDGLVDYVLVDPSGGRGVSFDHRQCSEIMKGVRERMPETAIGVAGGFSGDNVYLRFLDVAHIFQEPFSIGSMVMYHWQNSWRKALSQSWKIN